VYINGSQILRQDHTRSAGAGCILDHEDGTLLTRSSFIGPQYKLYGVGLTAFDLELILAYGTIKPTNVTYILAFLDNVAAVTAGTTPKAKQGHETTNKDTNTPRAIHSSTHTITT
jgi:hypothetical protein